MASPARRIAADVLLRVEQQGAFANLALDSGLRSAGVLEQREAALATELVYGTLRWQPQLDRAIESHSSRPIGELDAPVRTVLRMAAFELLHHPTVPARAAVHEAVELCKELRAGRAAGFANAVLRRLSEVRAAPEPPSREVDPIGHVAAITAHPRWIVERWTTAFGAAEAERLCQADQQLAPACVRVNRSRATLEEARAIFAAQGIEATPGRFSPDALVLAAGTPPALDLDGHAEGSFQAQDEAAQLVSLFAAPRAGARVLDACAAPGGKSCHLAELVGPTGRVVAVDLHARKAQIIAEAAARLGHAQVEARAADATLPLPGEGPGGFDLVLADAPCSGLGTLRRHPEVKLRRSVEDVDRLAALQARLLRALAAYVKPGGLLVYGLCTYTPEEVDENLARFLAAHGEFKLEPPPAGWALPAAEELVDERGCLVTSPARSGTDLFFAARLRRS